MVKDMYSEVAAHMIKRIGKFADTEAPTKHCWQQISVYDAGSQLRILHIGCRKFGVPYKIVKQLGGYCIFV